MNNLNLINSEITFQEKSHLYNAGVEKCLIGDYESAKKIFQVLCTLDNKNTLYIKALAGTLHNLGDYIQACFFYDYAYRVQSVRQNYDCLFYCANCLIKIEKNELAKSKLLQFIDLCNKDQSGIGYTKLVKRSLLLLKGLLK